MTSDFSASLSRLRTEYEDLVKDLRPELHRYCARIVGSAIDAEDVVQEAMAAGFYALATTSVTTMRPWLFRIAHNKAIDHLRQPSTEPWDDQEVPTELGHPLEQRELVTMALSRFLQLTVKQRSCVVLKDVLGHSLADIAELLDASLADVKAALHRGRARLRALSSSGDSAPRVEPHQLDLLNRYVDRFNARDFEALRTMLADDVRLDLVNRSQRRGADVGFYFTRYGDFHQWFFAPGLVEDRLAILIYDKTASTEVPYSFILLHWDHDKVSFIRDYLFVPYVSRECQVERLGT